MNDLNNLQVYGNKLRTELNGIKGELYKLRGYETFVVNRDYEDKLNAEYRELCNQVLILKRKIESVATKLDNYKTQLNNYERYNTLKEYSKNIELLIDLTERGINYEKERIKYVRI